MLLLFVSLIGVSSIMKFYNRLIGTAGGIFIGAMMFLIVAEVLSRLFLGSSIEGTIEIVGMFLALSVFLGFSPCEEGNHHIRVILVLSRLPTKLASTINIFVYILAFLTVVVITWQVGLDALSSLKIKEVLPGAKIHVPVYPAKIAAFIGYLSFCFQLLINLILKIKDDKKEGSLAE